MAPEFCTIPLKLDRREGTFSIRPVGRIRIGTRRTTHGISTMDKTTQDEVDEEYRNRNLQDEEVADEAADPLAELVLSAERALEQTEEIIRKHPLESVLVGVGIGFLLGLIMSDD